MKLNPCPFCGGVAEMIIDTVKPYTGEHHKEYAVRCAHGSCWAESADPSYYATEEVAARLWNTRADSALVERLEALVKTLRNESLYQSPWYHQVAHQIQQIIDEYRG